MAQLEVCLVDGTFTTIGNPGTVTSITAGTGLSGGTITSSGTIAIANTAITAGSFSYPTSITFNAQGQATAATSGTAPVLSVSGSTNIATSGTATAPIISLTNDITITGGLNSATLVTTSNATVGGTGYLRIPVGTTAQRPASPLVGMIRINTSL